MNPAAGAIAAALLLLCFVSAGTGHARQLERSVSEVPVEESDGRVLRHPFAGGYDTPIPDLADVDGDGDLDLFVLDDPDALHFFERTGPGPSDFAWRSERFEGIAVGDWFRFGDGDGDGDPDLFSQSGFDAVAYHENADGQWVLLTDSLFDASGRLLRMDPPAVPAFGDVDCDGDLDLLTGRQDGTAFRYERVASSGSPSFALIDSMYQDIQVVGGAGKSGAPATGRHGANALAVLDREGDGDADLLWGDFFEPSLVQFTGTGPCEAPTLVRSADTLGASVTPLITRGLNVPAIGDLVGDGLPDLVVGVANGSVLDQTDNLRLYENTGGQFAASGRVVDAIDVGGNTGVAAVDIDGDGDPDLLVAPEILPGLARSAVTLLRNIGSAGSPRFRFESSDYFPDLPGVAPVPAAGDLDADGDPDVVFGRFDGTLLLYRNTGSPSAPEFEMDATMFPGVDVGGHSAPALGDVDGDGDLDLVVGEFSGTLNYWRNNGTASTPLFVLESDNFAGIDVGQHAVPDLADLNGDGAADLVIGSEREGVGLYFGTPGVEGFPATPDSVLAAQTRFSTPRAVDVDGDGDLDLVGGTAGGGVMLYLNRTDTAVDRERSPRRPGAGIFPLPMTDQVRLELSGWPPDRPVSVTMYDVLGRRRLTMSVVPGETNAALDVTGLSPGVYFLSLASGDIVVWLSAVRS